MDGVLIFHVALCQCDYDDLYPHRSAHIIRANKGIPSRKGEGKMSYLLRDVERSEAKRVFELIAFEEREDKLRRQRRAELIASGENPDVVPLPRRPWE
jgi:hypothetical protein